MLYSAVYLDGGEVSLSILPSVDDFASYNREIMFPHCQNPIRFHSNKSQGGRRPSPEVWRSPS